jgi:hypothetical protein
VNAPVVPAPTVTSASREEDRRKASLLSHSYYKESEEICLSRTVKPNGKKDIALKMGDRCFHFRRNVLWENGGDFCARRYPILMEQHADSSEPSRFLEAIWIDICGRDCRD